MLLKVEQVECFILTQTSFLLSLCRVRYYILHYVLLLVRDADICAHRTVYFYGCMNTYSLKENLVSIIESKNL